MPIIVSPAMPPKAMSAAAKGFKDLLICLHYRQKNMYLSLNNLIKKFYNC